MGYFHAFRPMLEPVRAYTPSVQDIGRALAWKWTPLVLLVVCALCVVARFLYAYLRPKRSGYESAQYWDVRYKLSKKQKINEYEWYFVDDELLSYGVAAIGDKRNRVLDLGCGQSTYADQLYDKGYHKMVCTDYSEFCIQERKRLSRRDKMEFMKVDGREMPFPDASFDAVIEKATFDSIIFKRDNASKLAAEQVLAECVRVLKPGGRLLSISINNPTIWAEYVSHPSLVIDASLPNKRIVRTLNGQSMNFYISTVVKKK